MNNKLKEYVNKITEKDNDVYNRQKKFTEKVCELLNITNNELSTIVHKTPNHQLILKIEERLYCIASHQFLQGWNVFFHITKAPVLIHNINEIDACDLHRSQGTSSYSFTVSDIIIQHCYDAIKSNRFTIISQLERSELISNKTQRIVDNIFRK